MAAFLVDVLAQPPQVLGGRESVTLDSASEIVLSIIQFFTLSFRLFVPKIVFFPYTSDSKKNTYLNETQAIICHIRVNTTPQ